MNRLVLRSLVLAFTVSLATGVGCARDVRAQARTVKPAESALKAAFIYNFTKFVRWPSDKFADEATPIDVCVLHDQETGDALVAMESKTAQGRSFDVRVLHDIKDFDGCHIAYFPSVDDKTSARVLETLQHQHLLTIGNADDFAQRGGIIKFVSREGRIQFEINLDAAYRADLKISSKLLQLAEIYREEQ